MMTNTEQAEKFNGRHIEPMGGCYWRCTDCNGVIVAECACCEPPHCNHGREVKN